MADDDWDFSRPMPGPSSAPQSSGFGGGAPPPGATPSDPFGRASFPTNDAPPTFDFDSNRSASPPSPFGTGPVGPPIAWLVAGAIGALIGLAVAAVNISGVVYYIVGWAVCGPIAIGLLTGFARRDAQRQTVVTYGAPGWTPLAYRAVMALCFVAVVAEAFRIADWAGHR